MNQSVCSHICLLAMLAASAAIHAAELPATKAPPVTNAIAIETLVADVVEHNPELNFYRAEIAAAKGERRSAGTLANPELSTELGRKLVRGGGASDEGIAWSVAVQQSFEWPGRIPLRKAIANQQIKLAELGLAQFRVTLASKARKAAYDLWAAEQKSAAANEVAERFETLRAVLVQRDPAGLTPALETRIIEASELTLQRQASAELLDAQTALLELNQLRGRAWDSSLRIDQPKFSFAAVPDSNALIEAARTNNFEVQLRKAELEQQGFRISLARNERFPAVAVGPYVSQERAGETETIFGLGATVPLPLWNRSKGSIEVARAREAQAATSLYVAQREVERKVAEQALRYRTKLAEMAKWRPDSIEQFREAATLADRHYRLGAVPVATYVELQKQYLEAVEALLETRREALEAGQQIQLLTGVDLNSPQTPGETKK